jgi:hypothetical protein
MASLLNLPCLRGAKIKRKFVERLFVFFFFYLQTQTLFFYFFFLTHIRKWRIFHHRSGTPRNGSTRFSPRLRLTKARANSRHCRKQRFVRPAESTVLFFSFLLLSVLALMYGRPCRTSCLASCSNWSSKWTN